VVKAYLSSTFTDLRDHRSAAHEALRRLGVETVAMEEHVASEARPVEKCLEDVADCDFYIGIVAWRYGYIPTGFDASITELEYREAVRLDKRVLVFLVDENEPWPTVSVDRGPDAGLVERFRNALAQERACSYFVDPDQLAALVTDSMTVELADRARAVTTATLSRAAIDRYRDTVRRRFGQHDLDPLVPQADNDFVKIQLPPIFIEPKVAGGRMLLDVVKASRNRRIVLLGDPGSGKSTLVHVLLRRLSGGDPGDEWSAALGNPLPLLVELGAFAREESDVLGYLDHNARNQGLGLERAALEIHLAEGAALVLFDGLDEILDPVRREQASQQIATFSETYPHVRIVVTTRTATYSPSVLDRIGFSSFTLDPLDDDQIGTFIERWFAVTLPDSPKSIERSAEVATAAANVHPLRELAGNPLFLTMLADIGRDREIPSGPWKLFEYASSIMLERWASVGRQASLLTDDTDPLDAEDWRRLLGELAFEMFAAAGGAEMTRADIDRRIESYLVHRLQIDADRARQTAQHVIARLHTRGSMLQPLDDNRYAFIHTAFLEHFCALQIVSEFQARNLSVEDLVSISSERCQNSSWRRVVRLVSTSLADIVTGELVSRLVNQIGKPWPPGRFERPPWEFALAIEILGDASRILATTYQAPARHALDVLILLLEHGVSIQDRDTAQLVDEVIVPAARRIGGVWPGRRRYMHWYHHRGVRLRWKPISEQAATLAGIFASPQAPLLSLFQQLSETTTDPTFTRAAVIGLAELGRTIKSRVGLWADTDLASHLILLARYASESEDVPTRQAALEALNELYPDSPAAGETIVAAVRRDDTPPALRATAIRLLDERHADAQQLLLERMTDEDSRVRLAAVCTLPRIVNVQAWRAVLVERVRQDADPEVLEAAADILLRLGADIGDLLIARAIEMPDGRIRRTAISLLAAGKIDLGFFRQRLVTDSDPGVVRIIAVALVRSGSEPAEIRDVLIQQLRIEEAAPQRAAAVEALAAVYGDDRDAQHALAVTAREDANPFVRFYAVSRLGRLLPEHPDNVRALLECALHDLDASVQYAAQDVVSRAVATHPAVVQASVNLLGARNPAVRATAVHTLLKAPPDAVKPHLARVTEVAYDDVSPPARAAAIRLLLQIAPDQSQTLDFVDARLRLETHPDAIAALGAGVRSDRGHNQIILSRLAQETDYDVITALASVHCAGLGAGKELRSALLDRVADRGGPRIRAAALGLLGEFFAVDADVRRRLIDAVRDPAAAVRETAVRALCLMAVEDDDVRALVIEWAANAPDKAIRSIAGQAMTWLPGTRSELLPDLNAEPEPPTEHLTEPNTTADPAPVIEQVPTEFDSHTNFARLGSVFRQTGLPTLTFVTPPEFDHLMLALSQPGLGIVIEGPSGIGKTTLVHACLDKLKEQGYEVEPPLSGRILGNLPRLQEIAADEPHGIVVVDDFHRLPADLREQLADHLKLLADRGDESRRLIIVGIPETGHNLILFGNDLKTRIAVLRIGAVPGELVLEMIRRGERALNVSFNRADQVVDAVAGSLNIAQILCLHMAHFAGVTGTSQHHRVIDEGVERALGYLDTTLRSTYKNLVHTFCSLDGTKRRTCIDLLLRLGLSDGSLSLDEVRESDPGMARDIQTALLERFPNGFDGPVGDVFKNHLFFDSQSRQLVAEDPMLLFHLRQRNRGELIQSSGKREIRPRSQIFISYSHLDGDWLARLRKHLSPLKARDFIDLWSDKDLNPGDRWRDEIENALDRTKIAILLITQNFLDSAFITEVELPKLINASRTDGCRIWPLIIAPSVFTAIPELAEINTFNPIAKPLIGLALHEQEQVLTELALATIEHFPA
jgi:GTPase SAR1 family protein